MNTHEALEIIKAYQKWRTGEDERTMTDISIEPRKLTLAIEIAILCMGERVRWLESNNQH